MSESSSRTTPPARAEALLIRLLPSGPAGLSILGDLREEFAQRATRKGAAPRFWYWWQALRLGARYGWHRASEGPHPSQRGGGRSPREGIMRDLWGDLRFAIRMLVKTPAVAGVVIVTLALAIGSNTIVFSFANLLLIRPLPFHEIERVVAVFAVDPRRGNDRASVSLPDLIDWQSQARMVESLSAFESASYTLTGRGDPERVRAMLATADLFEAWGLSPVEGRLFAAHEDRPGADPVVVLSHRYWKEKFGSDRGVLGEALSLNSAPHTVVGVLTPEIEIGTLSLVDLWIPLALDPTQPRDRRTLEVTARLKAAATREQAAAEFRSLAERLEEAHPETNTGWQARVVPLTEAMVGRNTWLLLVLLGLSVAFVLLIACANVANVLLARASVRSREMAVRLAMGAGRFRLARQLGAESLLLGLLGGALGVLLAHTGLAAIRAVDAEPFFQMLTIDKNVLFFIALLSVMIPVFISLAPILEAARTDLRSALHEGRRGATGGPRVRRRRAALVVIQLSLATALLVVSGLVVRTVLAIERVELGFSPNGLLMARLELDAENYPEPARRRNFMEALLARLEGVPGVRHVAATDRLPLLDGEASLGLRVAGRPEPLPAETPWAIPFRVSPDYLRTMGIPLERGRLFAETDRENGALVALVNREMASRYWPDGESPLGSRVKLIEAASEGPWVEIVGIVGNVLGSDLDGPTKPQVYLPMLQHSERAMVVLLRTTGNTDDVVTRLRGEVSAFDRSLALFDVEMVTTALARVVAPTRITSGMFIGFASAALLLAATGLYGVMSYTVSVRMHEFGTRIALGARAADIRRLVLLHGVRLVLAGVGLGLLAGLGLAQMMKSVRRSGERSDDSRRSRRPARGGGVARELRADPPSDPGGRTRCAEKRVKLSPRMAKTRCSAARRPGRGCGTGDALLRPARRRSSRLPP